MKLIPYIVNFFQLIQDIEMTRYRNQNSTAERPQPATDAAPATALLVRSTPSTPAHRSRPAGRMRRNCESIREADGINLVDEGDAFGFCAQDDVPAGENLLTWTTTRADNNMRMAAITVARRGNVAPMFRVTRSIDENSPTGTKVGEPVVAHIRTIGRCIWASLMCTVLEPRS